MKIPPQFLSKQSTKETPKGYHKMPGGKLMKGESHSKMAAAFMDELDKLAGVPRGAHKVKNATSKGWRYLSNKVTKRRAGRIAGTHIAKARKHKKIGDTFVSSGRGLGKW